MPCYDKKLEAVRPNFTLGVDESLQIKEVDTVLATHELVELINNLATQNDLAASIDSFSQINPFVHKNEEFKLEAGSYSPQAQQFLEVMRMFVDASCGSEKFSQISRLNTTSNGYLEYIFRRTAKEVFGVTIDPMEPLVYVPGKNKDLKECQLTVKGQVVLRFAAAYGFRNIQNIIRNIKRGKCEYDYIEVMACPGGCLNGGGQIKPKDFGLDP